MPSLNNPALRYAIRREIFFVFIKLGVFLFVRHQVWKAKMISLPRALCFVIASHVVQKTHPAFSFIVVLCLSFAGLNCAEARLWRGFGPINTRTQNPVYLQSLGLTATRAEVLPEGTFEWRVDSAYSNLYEHGTSGSNILDLDMEFWRISPNFSYGLTRDLEVGIEIPLVHFNGGFLDGFIQKFHNFFGFPNGGRENVPNGRFSYLAAAHGETLFDYSSAAMGLGDITLNLKHQLTGECADLPALAIFANIKFPTGKSSHGFGNGSPDFGLGIAVEDSWKRLHGYFNAYYMATGGNENIGEYMHNEMFAFMIAGELSILPDWSFIVQLNGSTPLLTKMNIDEWDGVPLDLVVGFKGEEQKLMGSHDFIWQFGFAEDVTSRGPSVDFTVFLSLGLRFDLFGRTRPAGDWLASRD